jgi:uncharacterized glyoxalase superfamily protein PhnB
MVEVQEMAAEQQLTKFRGIAPSLPVADVAAAAVYYRDKLGFTIRPVMPDSADYWVIAERGPVEIHLVPKDWPSGFLILIDNVDQMVAELMARGAQCESGPENQQYDMRNFTVSDPDGHQILFWQPLPPAHF